MVHWNIAFPAPVPLFFKISLYFLKAYYMGCHVFAIDISLSLSGLEPWFVHVFPAVPAQEGVHWAPHGRKTVPWCPYV